MLIKFLGTSAGWPLPRLSCNCDICISKDPRDKRRRPALLINEKVLIDAGPDAYYELIDQNPEKIETVIITHDHWDHTYGLSDLSKIYNRKKKPILTTTQEVLKSLRRSQSHPPHFSFKVEAVKPLESTNIIGVQTEFLPVFHSKSTPTYGISLESKVFYIPDYKTIPPKSLKKLKNAEILILDGSGFQKMFNHATIDEGIALAKKVKAQKVYFTHIGHKTKPHKELTEYVQKHGGKNFHTAYDGLEIRM